MLETKIATKLTGQSKVEFDGKTVPAVNFETTITEEGASTTSVVVINRNAYLASIKACRADEDAFRVFAREREDMEVSENEE